MEGIGEKLTFINYNQKLDLGIVLINPNIPLSTNLIFNSLRENRKKKIKVFKIQDINDISKIIK